MPAPVPAVPAAPETTLVCGEATETAAGAGLGIGALAAASAFAANCARAHQRHALNGSRRSDNPRPRAQRQDTYGAEGMRVHEQLRERDLYAWSNVLTHKRVHGRVVIYRG